jgi:hypothetical protein
MPFKLEPPERRLLLADRAARLIGRRRAGACFALPIPLELELLLDAFTCQVLLGFCGSAARIKALAAQRANSVKFLQVASRVTQDQLVVSGVHGEAELSVLQDALAMAFRRLASQHC